MTDDATPGPRPPVGGTDTGRTEGRRTGRVGMGFDVHPVSDDESRPMVLGGVRFDGPGLAGHSDSDPAAMGPVAVVVGAEGRGLGRLVGERCEVVARVP